jgi:capsid protein
MTAIMSTESPGDVEEEFKHDTDEVLEDKTWTTITMPSGQIMFVPQSDTFHEFKSDHPSQTYESFVKGVKGDVAIGQLMSYLSLTRDGTGVNYSSMRGLYLQDRMVFKFDRSYLKRRFLQWVWGAFCDECVLAGWAEAPFYTLRRHAYTRVSWQFGPWGWVDPVKEVTAKILAKDANIQSHAEIVEAEGGNVEDVIDANIRAEKYEKDAREAAGLGPKKPTSPPPPPPDENEDEDEEDARDRALLEIAEALRDGSRNGNGRSKKRF